MSTHSVDVVRATPEPHPNADRLAIVRVYGYTAIVAKDAWTDGDLGAYIPPDSLVDPTRPEFEFLAASARPGYGSKDRMVRIKAKRLRGVWSQGLLVKAPDGLAEGDDAMEALGVEHYEPPIKLTGQGVSVRAPRHSDFGKYDLEPWRKWGRRVFEDGEPVAVTEKIHGANCRVVFDDEGLHVGSRSLWKGDTPTDAWWNAVRATPGLAAMCESHRGHVVFGEVYGWVQELRYGATPGQTWFRAFDVRRPDGTWLDHAELDGWCLAHDVPMVPVLYVGAYDAALMESLAEGSSTIPGANHVREGCVIRPIRERAADGVPIDRTVLKLVGNGYLEKAE